MIDFAQVPKVAFAEMNRIHAEEVALLNRLDEVFAEGSEDEVLEGVIEELLEHTKHHFANEERLMREVGFPPLMMHKSEHDRFLNEVGFVVMDWRTTKDRKALREYFGYTVPEWLNRHIATMDTVTAQFICMRKGC